MLHLSRLTPLIVFFIFNSIATQLSSQPAVLLLPETNRGWKIIEPLVVYSGDDLYFMVDGGADLFLEYGFVEVAAADYSKESSKLHVEVYEMESPEKAWGIYSIRRPYSADKQFNSNNIAIGKGYTMAANSSFYYVISAQSKEVDPDDIYKLTEEITNEISNKTDADQSRLIRFTPGKYDCIFYGRAGFSSVYSLGASNFQGFIRGLAERKTKEEITIRLEYANLASALDDFKKFSSVAANNERFKLLEMDREKILISDRGKTKVLIQSDSSNLILHFFPADI